MIREFEEADLKGFAGNHLSPMRLAPDALKDDHWVRCTLLDETTPKAFLSFKPYQGDDWICFSVISEDFGLKHAKEFRSFFDKTSVHIPGLFGDSTLWTVGTKDKTITRWLKFLGFQHIDDIQVEGKDCLLWRMECPKKS